MGSGAINTGQAYSLEGANMTPLPEDYHFPTHYDACPFCLNKKKKRSARCWDCCYKRPLIEQPSDTSIRHIPLTKGLFTIVDASDYEWLNQWKWSAIHKAQGDAPEEQKSAQAQFKQRVEAEIATIGKLSNNINMGWEMREIECLVDYHKPNQGFKTITRLDTGEVVREMQMQGRELQENLFRDGL